MFQNFRKVEKTVQQIPIYPSHRFINYYFATFALSLYVYMFINIYFTESYESYKDHDILPLNVSPKN